MGNFGQDNVSKLLRAKTIILQNEMKKYNIDTLKELEGKSLYHGTIGEFEGVFLEKDKIDVFHGKKGTKDNGFGFYLTLNEEQAFEQGRRKQIEYSLKSKKGNLKINTDIMVVEAQINLNELEAFFRNHNNKDYLLYKTLEIDEHYGKFIINNRLGEGQFESFIGEMHNLSNQYALVYGGMADGKVGKLIQEYSDGLNTLTDAVSKLEYQAEFVGVFIKEVNKPFKTGKGSQLSIHDNELFNRAVDIKGILKDS